MRDDEAGIGSDLRARTGRGLALVLSLALSALPGCSDLLDVDLTDAITDEALEDPGGAEIQTNSAIAVVECAYSAFVAGNAAGNEDVYLRIASGMAGFAEYTTEVGTGTCDTTDGSYAWWQGMQTGRLLAEGTYDRLTDWSSEDVEERERLLAVTALYAAVPYDVFGEHVCEITVEGGPPMTPDETLEVAESWVTTALDHIATTGDFPLDNGVASSIEQTAYGLRARIRWARGPDHWSGAAADAARVDEGFVAWVSREAGLNDRRNKVAVAHHTVGYGTVIGPITWWNGDVGSGDPWPTPLPFTGYLDLAVAGDGRSVDMDGRPITTELDGAVPDPRVDVSPATLSDGYEGHRQNKYTSGGDDIPLVNWEEMWLIRAEVEGDAVARVNEIRAAHDLPSVAYAPEGEEIERLILEERRRSLFLEGRFWSTKIQNPDRLWFPRNQGVTPEGDPYGGAVRMLMDVEEYDLNEHLSRSDRATMCDEDQRPVLTS